MAALSMISLYWYVTVNVVNPERRARSLTDMQLPAVIS